MCDDSRFCKTSWLWVTYQFSLPVACMRPSLETTSAEVVQHVSSIWMNQNIFHHVILGSFPYTSCPSISVFYHQPSLCVCVSRSPVRVESGSLPLKASHEGRVANFIRFNAGTSWEGLRRLLAGGIFGTAGGCISCGVFFAHGHATISLKWLWDRKNRQRSLFEKYKNLTSHIGKGSEISCAAVSHC